MKFKDFLMDGLKGMHRIDILMLYKFYPLSVVYKRTWLSLDLWQFSKTVFQ